jgi:hypothetical protein
MITYLKTKDVQNVVQQIRSLKNRVLTVERNYIKLYNKIKRSAANLGIILIRVEYIGNKHQLIPTYISDGAYIIVWHQTKK